MSHKNNHKSVTRNQPEGSTQPEPLSGSKKVKNKKHSRQKNNSHHDM